MPCLAEYPATATLDLRSRRAQPEALQPVRACDVRARPPPARSETFAAIGILGAAGWQSPSCSRRSPGFLTVRPRLAGWRSSTRSVRSAASSAVPRRLSQGSHGFLRLRDAWDVRHSSCSRRLAGALKLVIRNSLPTPSVTAHRPHGSRAAGLFLPRPQGHSWDRARPASADVPFSYCITGSRVTPGRITRGCFSRSTRRRPRSNPPGRRRSSVPTPIEVAPRAAEVTERAQQRGARLRSAR